jgi:hypothetical protein
MPDVFVSKPPKKESDSKVEIAPEIPATEQEKRSIPGHTHNKLSAFSVYPEGVGFETLGEEEKIVLLVRAHLITNVKWILVTLLMIIAPGVVQSFGLLLVFPVGLQLIITLSWYLITMAYALESFLSWYFNVYIVTNLRVIDVDFFNLVYKQVSDANIDKIQDVTYNMGGVIRTIFNYGDVFVQTAAEVSEFEFLAVPYPDKVVKIIGDLIEKSNKDDVHI